MEHQALALPTFVGSNRPSASLRVVVSESRSAFVPAEQLWSPLCNGLLKIQRFWTEERHVGVVLEERSSPVPRIAGRRLRALELLLQGTSQSAIAIDLGVAPSTMSADLKSALRDLGIEDRVFALPAFVPQLSDLASASRLVRIDVDAGEPRRRTAWLPRVDLELSRSLAPAEVDVCRLLLAGLTHEQIARARGRARRTVANQLAAVFTKLKVSGRQELLTCLVRRASAL